VYEDREPMPESKKVHGNAKIRSTQPSARYGAA